MSHRINGDAKDRPMPYIPPHRPVPRWRHALNAALGTALLALLLGAAGVAAVLLAALVGAL
jgi:hypothetical protein